MSACDQWASFFPASQQAMATCVCNAESGGNANAHAVTSLEDSRGLGQINVLAHPDAAGLDLYDPSVNAQYSLQLWQSSGWGPWTTAGKSGACGSLASDTAANASGSSLSLPSGPALLIGGGLVLGALLLWDYL